MPASQRARASPSAVSAVIPPHAPSSCSGPRDATSVCNGWTLKRVTWGSSAASGVAPLTCASQGPAEIDRATCAMAPSGTASTMRSARVDSGSSTPCSARRAATADPARPRPTTATRENMTIDHDILYCSWGLASATASAQLAEAWPALPAKRRRPTPTRRAQRRSYVAGFAVTSLIARGASPPRRLRRSSPKLGLHCPPSEGGPPPLAALSAALRRGLRGDFLNRSWGPTPTRSASRLATLAPRRSFLIARGASPPRRLRRSAPKLGLHCPPSEGGPPPLAALSAAPTSRASRSPINLGLH